MSGCVVSVIIPVYNSAGCLRQCLDSLLSQTFRDIEVICVNDGSTDGSEEIIREYAECDTRVVFLDQANSGAGAARNKGLDNAHGEYIMFLDSDDEFEHGMIELMLRKMQQTDSDAAICCADAFDDESGDIRSDIWTMPLNLLGGDTVFSPKEKGDVFFKTVQGWPWDKMFRRSLIERWGLRYPDLPNSQDLVFVFGALACADRICVVDRVLVHRRMNRHSSISNSRAGAVTAPYTAVKMLIALLEQKGTEKCFICYERSLYSFTLNFWLWHMRTLAGKPQEKCYKLMREQWFKEFDFDRLPQDIYQVEDHREYKRILRTPYWRYNMANKIKKVLKNILPPPVNVFNRENQRVKDAIVLLRREISDSMCENDIQVIKLIKENDELRKQINELNTRLNEPEKD